MCTYSKHVYSWSASSVTEHCRYIKASWRRPVTTDGSLMMFTTRISWEFYRKVCAHTHTPADSGGSWSTLVPLEHDGKPGWNFNIADCVQRLAWDKRQLWHLQEITSLTFVSKVTKFLYIYSHFSNTDEPIILPAVLSEVRSVQRLAQLWCNYLFALLLKKMWMSQSTIINLSHSSAISRVHQSQISDQTYPSDIKNCFFISKHFHAGIIIKTHHRVQMLFITQ